MLATGAIEMVDDKILHVIMQGLFYACLPKMF